MYRSSGGFEYAGPRRHVVFQTPHLRGYARSTLRVECLRHLVTKHIKIKDSNLNESTSYLNEFLDHSRPENFKVPAFGAVGINRMISARTGAIKEL